MTLRGLIAASSIQMIEFKMTDEDSDCGVWVDHIFFAHDCGVGEVIERRRATRGQGFIHAYHIA